MSFPELRFLLGRILESEPARLRWVFVDSTFYWAPRPENFGTRRIIAWHDLPTALLATGLALLSEDPERLGVNGARGHLTAFGDRLTNAGRLAELLGRATGVAEVEESPKPTVRGFRALDAGAGEG